MLAPQPAATANVPEQLASIQNAELRDRAPQYQHIARNVYMRGIQRPKRQARDDIHVCNCRAPQGAFGALPARQPTQRQANSTLHKQMLQKVAAAAAAAAAARGAAAAPTAAGDDSGGRVAAGQQPVPLQQADASPASAATVATDTVPAPAQVAANGADAASPSGPAPATADAAAPGSTPSPIAMAVPAQPLGCGEDCLNRLSFIHCDPKLCPCGEACSNR